MTASHHSSNHEAEWLYSTAISHKLSPLNEYIHNISSVPHPIELFIAFCGYAFNPVMFPLWPILIYTLTYRGLSNTAIMNSVHKPNLWQTELLTSFDQVKHGALVNTALYLSSVLITLIFTELGKASFATTRPGVIKGYHSHQQYTRRYGKLVGSLKSKHSFPSGDSAQAMALCVFLWRYVPLGRIHGNALPITILLFGVFLPGVLFARVFYRCHWIEDCIGGVTLSLMLHQTVIPFVGTKIMEEIAPRLFSEKVE